jgi:hypothetical protein
VRSVAPVVSLMNHTIHIVIAADLS